jgi:hypothetical protein
MQFEPGPVGLGLLSLKRIALAVPSWPGAVVRAQLAGAAGRSQRAVYVIRGRVLKYTPSWPLITPSWPLAGGRGPLPAGPAGRGRRVTSWPLTAPSWPGAASRGPLAVGRG